MLILNYMGVRGLSLQSRSVFCLLPVLQTPAEEQQATVSVNTEAQNPFLLPKYLPVVYYLFIIFFLFIDKMIES